jgi:hypothetical protein
MHTAATGNNHGRAFRCLETEAEVLKLTQRMGIGAQFGGKYFCHDVRVIRLPRHGASCPVGLGVSCSADRQARGKVCIFCTLWLCQGCFDVCLGGRSRRTACSSRSWRRT